MTIQATHNGSVAVLNTPPTSSLLEEGLKAVEQLMHDLVNSDVAILRDASRHILAAGGKRIRPRLVLLTYAAFGGKGLDDAVKIASAIELIHTASVVHDDINDHGVLRRGRPSVNALWGRTFALLTGDFIFTKVYELMAPYKDLNSILAEATVALVEGETLQAAAVKDGNFTRETYFAVIARKTAPLFKAAASLGAKLAKAAPEQVETLAQYGFNLGLAFQIVDDILDLTGNTEKLGKTAGIDLMQGKGFAATQPSNGDLAKDSDPMAIIKRAVMDGDTIRDARAYAHRLVTTANASLAYLPDSDEKTALMNLSRMVIDRDY